VRADQTISATQLSPAMIQNQKHINVGLFYKEFMHMKPLDFFQKHIIIGLFYKENDEHETDATLSLRTPPCLGCSGLYDFGEFPDQNNKFCIFLAINGGNKYLPFPP
jgi:hypothetical protein